MTKKILYLHIGWSKTGTSAVQEHLNNNFEVLKSRGILYSQVMQMNDNAHHNFALAFQATHGYPARFTVQEALENVDNEMKSNHCNSLILSSELSPQYFNNPKFKVWVEKFDEVRVIASVRKQSELLLSLFNQLIKDPQVRYPGTIFQLTLNNIVRLNYYQNLARWANFVTLENIDIINYEDGIVPSFLSYFSLDGYQEDSSKITNPSLPIELLISIQNETKGINCPAEYRSIRDRIVSENKDNKKDANRLLISRGELATIDAFFSGSNNRLAKEFLSKETLFSPKSYKDIYVY